jgi:23S rRNA (cytosine1962-C5)-methyltransferase
MPMTHKKHEPRAIVRADKSKPFARRHPWIFAGAIQSVMNGEPTDGDLISLYDPSGDFLARGYYNSRSQIRVRALSWQPDEVIDAEWWAARLQRAIQARAAIGSDPTKPTNAYRLVNAENDGLPGLIVDRYGDYLVIQAQTLGIDVRKAEIVAQLVDLLHPVGIFERSDDDEMRHKEGLTASVGVLYGEAPPELIEIYENGHRFLIDVRLGHKTGFYLDQRETRDRMRQWVQAETQAGHGDLSVLNCFSYSGGFAVYGLAGGAARVVNLDSSADALALAKRNVAINVGPHYQPYDDDFVEADVFAALRRYRDSGEQFDVVILDPPKFAQTQTQVDGACRGYKDINWLAFRLIKPGGLLLTCSCSGAIDADLFQKVVFGALVDARREAQIIARLGPGADHPAALTFPEGSYLKGLLCRVW